MCSNRPFEKENLKQKHIFFFHNEFHYAKNTKATTTGTTKH